MSLHGLVLAAGAGRRMGRTKALMVRHGETFVSATVAALMPHVAEVHVAIGDRAEDVRSAHRDLDVCWIEVMEWQEGMGRSLAIGIAALAADAQVRSVLVTPCDLPYFNARVAGELVDCFQRSSRSVVACGYENTIGVPAVFARSWFDRLLCCSGDRGARDLLRANTEEIEVFSWPEGALDSDLPDPGL